MVFKLRSTNSPLKVNIDFFGVGKAISDRRKEKRMKKEKEEQEVKQYQDQLLRGFDPNKPGT